MRRIMPVFIQLPLPYYVLTSFDIIESSVARSDFSNRLDPAPDPFLFRFLLSFYKNVLFAKMYFNVLKYLSAPKRSICILGSRSGYSLVTGSVSE
jgi:hypothetical protein